MEYIVVVVVGGGKTKGSLVAAPVDADNGGSSSSAAEDQRKKNKPSGAEHRSVAAATVGRGTFLRNLLSSEAACVNKQLRLRTGKNCREHNRIIARRVDNDGLRQRAKMARRTTRAEPDNQKDGGSRIKNTSMWRGIMIDAFVFMMERRFLLLL